VRAAAVVVRCAEQCAQGATAAAAVGARTAGFRYLISRRRPIGDNLSDNLTGYPITQADEHREAAQSSMRIMSKNLPTNTGG
jgi:hypothetical protein